MRTHRNPSSKFISGAHLIILLNSATVNVEASDGYCYMTCPSPSTEQVPSEEPFRFMTLALRLLVAVALLTSELAGSDSEQRLGTWKSSVDCDVELELRLGETHVPHPPPCCLSAAAPSSREQQPLEACKADPKQW